MKKTTREVLEFAGALAMLTRRKNPDGSDAPRVEGKVGHPLVAFRVAQAIKKLTPTIEAFEAARREVIESCTVQEEGKSPKLDIPELEAKLNEILNEEIELPEIKPITWQVVESAELQLDAGLVLALGNFVQGEPTGA